MGVCHVIIRKAWPVQIVRPYPTLKTVQVAVRSRCLTTSSLMYIHVAFRY